ncbi:MAG: UvrD-helicase domain-containing protein [Cyanobacteria bacterium REEB67]|nr:UvrD-helicase domain-containing protein [Cyanobacteria bacterium REEB67]
MFTEQQQLAIDNVDKHVLVSAGAGSGKTHVLVERYIEILRKNTDLTLANIIAVTYTRKAAAEMRSRLKARFLALSKDQGERESGAYLRWLACLSEVDSARINTIHALCESILKSFPADSGIDPEFELLDELTTGELLEEAVAQALRDVIAAPEQYKLEYALLLEYPIDDVVKIVRDLIKNSTRFEEALRAFPQPLSVESMLTHAGNFIADARARAVSGLKEDRNFLADVNYATGNPLADQKSPLEAVRLEMLAYCQQIIDDDGANYGAAGWQAMIALGQVKTGTFGGPKAKPFRDRLRDLREMVKEITATVPGDLGPDDERAMQNALGIIGFFQRARAHYQAAKEKRTALDFNDQVALAKRCLEKSGSQAKSYFNEKIKALLVDEFQDTNDVQAELLLDLLAGADTRLFLIGDDKQSIYKFQGADVATFNRRKQMFANVAGGLIGALSGETMVTKLTKSFRSHPLVVAFVNAVFSRLLDGDPTRLAYVAAFEALTPGRALPENSAETAVDVLLFDEDDGDDQLAPDKLEAAHVALWIKEKIDDAFQIEEKGGVNRSIAYGDFAVLVGKNSEFAPFEEMFARFGIPYVTFGGRGFLSRQEVADFENLFRFLDNSKDSHSLLAVLRSPLCPLTDDLIHKVIAGENRNNKDPLWARLTEASRERIGGFESLTQAVRLLRTMLDYASLMPLGELVHKIITLTRYDLSMLAAGDGKQRSRNVWKLVHLARENEALSCGEFADKLAAMREMNLKEAEAPIDSRNAVKLMTIHASKGLEFPAVALPCLGGQASKTGGRFIFHRSYGAAFNTKRLKSDEKPAWYESAANLDKAMEVEERKRLLYVAMTRARDCLGLFIKHTARKTDSYRLWLRRILALDVDGFTPPDPGLRPVRDLLANGHTANFTLAYCYGRPPGLDLALAARSDHTYAEAIAAAANSRQAFWDEPAVSLFDTAPNELALVRLTPGGKEEISRRDDFAVLAPRVVGTFFHALMENLPLTKSVDREWVRDIAYNQGVHFVHPKRLDALVDEGLRLLEIYNHSRLRELVEKSHSRFNEMPYLVYVDDGERGVMTMRPDLLVEAADGQWHLVDFKTDHFNHTNAGAVEQQARKHRHQLKRYVDDLQIMAGVQIRPAIYFAQYGIYYPL